jgi:uncharacterized protein
MKISVKQCLNLRDKVLPLSFMFEMPQLKQRNKELIHLSPIQFNGQGRMASALFRISGSLSGEFTLPCARCLKSVTLPFTCSIEELFNIQASQSMLLETEDEIHEVIGHDIDLTPYVEEVFLVNIPYSISCQSQEACEVPQKGSGWSLSEKQETKESVDPRLAELAKFFDQKEH